MRILLVFSLVLIKLKISDGQGNYNLNVVRQRYLSHQESQVFLNNAQREMEKLSQSFSSKILVEAISHEKRAIKSFTVSLKSKPRNPVILIDAGIHAREWHSRSLGFYIIKKLIDEAKLQRSGLINNASFVIVPR